MDKRAAELIQAEERIARLEQELSEARETIEAERFERELLVREKAAALRRVEELETAPHAADVAGGKDGGGLREALRRAEERTETLRMEVERLAAGKAAVEKRLTEVQQAPGKGDLPPTAGSSSLPVDGNSSPPPHVVRRPPPKDAFFHVDWNMQRIEYASADNLLDVYHSMNMAQISLEGYHGQHCSAWIVGLRKEKSRQVHVVFGLSESGFNLVYSPARSLRNNEDYKKALSEAINFLEVVGYLPEKVPLGKSLPERGEALKRIPVLQEIEDKAQGF